MKNESKQPKTSISVTKRVFSFVVIFAVTVSCFASIVFVNAITYFDDQPFSEETQVAHASSTDCYVGSSSATAYYFWINYGDSYAIVAAGTVDDTAYISFPGLSRSYSGRLGAINGATVGYNNLVYLLITSVGFSYSQINGYGLVVFADVQSGLEELYEEMNSPTPSPDSANSLDISLPAGNILIADISNTGSNPYYLETTSGTTGAIVKPGMNNIQIGYSNTVPSSFTVPNSSWGYPSWSGTGNASVLGTFNRQSTQGDFALSNTNAQKYVIITNPMYPNDNNASANRLNSDLNIIIDKVNSYVIYSLQTGYVSGNLIGTNDGSQYIDYEFDEDTGEWVGTNQDGDPASPVWGGQNDFENTPTTINDWLENIAHQISSFFSGAIGAITTLSVAVKNFASTLMSLYVWLPSPVLSILSSAVMLAIVIGVIKVFI